MALMKLLAGRCFDVGKVQLILKNVSGEVSEGFGVFRANENRAVVGLDGEPALHVPNTFGEGVFQFPDVFLGVKGLVGAMTRSEYHGVSWGSGCFEDSLDRPENLRCRRRMTPRSWA